MSGQSANLDTSVPSRSSQKTKSGASHFFFFLLSHCHHLTAGSCCEGRLARDWASFSVHTSERNVWPGMNQQLIFDPHRFRFSWKPKKQRRTGRTRRNAFLLRGVPQSPNLWEIEQVLRPGCVLLETPG